MCVYAKIRHGALLVLSQFVGFVLEGFLFNYIYVIQTSISSMKNLRFTHKVTGDSFVVGLDANSLSLYRLNLKCRALQILSTARSMRLYFLTLTLSDDNVSVVNRELNRFMTFVRTRFKRAGLAFNYVWVAELQKTRYYKSGVLGLHWHFIIVCPDGALPDVRFNAGARRGKKYELVRDGDVISQRELYERWGYGQILCGVALSKSPFNYLKKYMQKDYGSFRGFNTAWFNLRRWGSSQVGYLGFPRWAYDRVVALLNEVPEYSDLYIRKVGARVGFYGREYLEKVRDDGKISGRYNYVPVHESRSPYRCVEQLPEIGS